MKIQSITPGTVIEANITANTSFYKKVIGTVTEVNGTFIKINATRVISKWSNEYKDHPTSCSMGVKASNVISILA